jgi:choline dehydrogenase
MKDNKNEMIADYVIVGAGSAGCVLASRLSEDPNCSVILIEAGGSDKNLIVQMPSAFYLPMQSKTLNWGYASEPEPNMNGRRLDCPRGRVLGGSSSINGMVYVRGNANDYERWEKLGAKGWGYSEVLPYFK